MVGSDLWLPIMRAGAALQNPGIFEARGSSSLYVFGRLKAGSTLAAASADIARVFADVQRIHRDSQGVTGEVLSMARGVQRLREQFEKPLSVLLGIVGLLLLIACANLAALLLARAAARRHEIAVRLSLGASQFRLVRQFLAESTLIAALSGAAGLLMAALGTSALIDLVTTSERRLPIAFTVDARMLLFTATISMTAAVLFGLFPALQANKTPLTQMAQTVRTLSRLAGGRLLVAAQMALSMFLLVGAGLFIRSLGNLRHLDTGFAREKVLIVMMDPRAAYGKDVDKYLVRSPLALTAKTTRSRNCSTSPYSAPRLGF